MDCIWLDQELAWGDTFFIYDPHRNLEGPKRFPFATIVIKDCGDFDNASKLDRPRVFRLNIGVSKETYASLFDTGAEHDFTALDKPMPHPCKASTTGSGSSTQARRRSRR